MRDGASRINAKTVGASASGRTKVFLVLLAVNALLQGHANDQHIVRALVPIDWAQLEPHLGRVVETGVDVGDHLGSYQEWKQAAEAGHAGVFTVSPAEILALLRETVRSGSVVG